MVKLRNVTDIGLTCPFLPVEVPPGGTVDAPDTQADGSPLVWSEHWQPVAERGTKADRKQQQEEGV